VSGLHDLLARSAAAGLRLQRPDGCLAAGVNGPYADPETPVRNTAHWLVLFATTHWRSGEARLRDAALRAAAFLTSEAARPAGATFLCRRRSGKDACNGLIGQAWAIEALAEAATCLDAEPLAKLAETVFLLHPFDAHAGLWRRVEVDGTVLGPDFTLNHQLWFAAAGSVLAPLAAAEVGLRVRAFLDALPRSLALHRDGAVRHPVSPGNALRIAPRVGLRLARERVHLRAALREKAIGYHAFNLHALATLRTRLPEHAFWTSPRFARAWGYAGSEAFRADVAGNRYAWPYNPTGFEMAWALEAFGPGSRAEQEGWVALQLRRHFDARTNLLSHATSDPATLAARLYEAARLGDLCIPEDALEPRP
jgi:hypothetical protein